MNVTDQNPNHAPTDDYADRLVDVALAELVGGKNPPDLTSRVLSDRIQPLVTSPTSHRRQMKVGFWVSFAAAAMLLAGATLALLPDVRNARESHRIVEQSRGFQNHHPTTEPLPNGATTHVPATSSRNINESVAANDNTLAGTAATGRRLDRHRDTDFGVNQNRPSDSLSTSGKITSTESARGDSSTFPNFTSDLGSAGPGLIANSTSSQTTEFYNSYSANSDPKSVPGFARGGPGGTPPSVPLTSLAGRGRIEAQAPRARGLALEAEAFTGRKQLREIELAPQTLADSGGYHWKDDVADLEGPSQKSAGGTSPDFSGDKYTRIVENPFVKAEGQAAVSTFSIDVDTASYTNVRQFLLQMNQLPPPDAVRIEELVNYFHYDYAPPSAASSASANTPSAPGSAGGSHDEAPFAAHVEVAGCPWAPEHRLARIGIKGRELDRNKRPQSNLVFLIDVSGSMDEPAKLPLVIYGLEQLTRELGENDHVAIVVYASSEGLVLPSTPGTKQETILAALGKLKAGGSTAGGAGIQLAYQLAEDHFIKGGTNRVILCTDGDFNVGVTSTAELERLVEKKAKDTGVFLSVLGFGRGNLNDTMMEAISNHGNGNYHYVDNRTEARRVLVEEMAGTLVTIAKDVKIQVEFNPAKVDGYRLIGYEDRMLRTEDFNDDKKDAGEIGAGHTVTALYEIVPTGKKVEVGSVDELKYQKPAGWLGSSAGEPPAGRAVGSATPRPQPPDVSKELLTLKIRYKAPDGETSKKLEWAIKDDGKTFSAGSADLKFASAVAGFGLLLRDSQYKGNLTYGAVREIAQGSLGEDPHGYRKEFLEMVRRAKELRHE